MDNQILNCSIIMQNKLIIKKYSLFFSIIV